MRNPAREDREQQQDHSGDSYADLDKRARPCTACCHVRPPQELDRPVVGQDVARQDEPAEDLSWAIREERVEQPIQGEHVRTRIGEPETAADRCDVVGRAADREGDERCRAKEVRCRDVRHPVVAEHPRRGERVERPGSDAASKRSRTARADRRRRRSSIDCAGRGSPLPTVPWSAAPMAAHHRPRSSAWCRSARPAAPGHCRASA